MYGCGIPSTFDLTSAAAKRLLRLGRFGRVLCRIAVDVIHDPVLQPDLHVVPLFERPRSCRTMHFRWGNRQQANR